MNETGHVTYFALMDSFDGCLFLRQSVFGLVDDSKAALAYLLFEEVLIFDVAVPGLDKKTFLDYDILVQPPVDDILLEFVVSASNLCTRVNVYVGAGQNRACLT